MFQQLVQYLAAIDTGLIATQPKTGSAILRAGVEQTTGKGGFTYTQIDNLRGQALPEGGKKVASGTAVVKKAVPEKFVTSTVYTDETIRFQTQIFQNVVDASPRANGVAYDRLVLGIDAKPTEFVAFDTFAGIAEEDVTDLTTFNNVIGGVPTTGIVGTRQFLGKLRSIVNGLGMPSFAIRGGVGAETDAFIGDIPFFILDKKVSTEAFAIAGDWSSHLNGKLYANDVVVPKDAGNIDDINGVTHNLTSENKTAVMVENWLASAIQSKDDFVRLEVPAAA